MIDYFFNEIFIKNDFSDCYDEEYDWFSKPYTSFVWAGKRKSKYTYKRASLTFYIEFYDIDIISKKYPVNTFYSWAFPRCLRRSAQCYKITLG